MEKSPLERKLAAMRKRLDEPNRTEGNPIIPNGPPAASADIVYFREACQAFGYTVLFAGPTQGSATNQGRMEVRLVRRDCTVGLLTDEYLHVWNNCGNRGKYFDDAAKTAHHRALWLGKRISGETNDREFHKLELENFILWVEQRNGAIPPFMWRTF